MVHDARIRHFAGIVPEDGHFVLYWMQQAQRIRCNHALVFAGERARDLGLPVVVGFVVTPGFPEAVYRHYRFMLEGIADVQAALGRMGVPFVIRVGEVAESVLSMAEGAAWVVTDAGYLRIQRQWRREVEQSLRCSYTEVETDVVVPVASASGKAEYAARTLRPKLMRQVEAFSGVVDFPEDAARGEASGIAPSDPVDPEDLASRVSTRGGMDDALVLRGGYAEARRLLEDFTRGHLGDYKTLSREPAAGCRSDLSAYLHFGQIAPVEILAEIEAADAPADAKEAFIEQLVVRRELAINFVYYTEDYDRYESAVPGWAKRTLADHEKDARPYLYSQEAFEAGRTHDPYWNAAQAEMVATGKMHNTMRMYWGKKIIEWTNNPKEAFDIMLALNNRYETDGRDANGFAGVAWCFGLHDRPWKEREIFGKVRYMNAAGLKRKYRIAQYVRAQLGDADGDLS